MYKFLNYLFYISIAGLNDGKFNLVSSNLPIDSKRQYVQNYTGKNYLIKIFYSI